MVKSYHVICVPLYFWESYEIKTKDQLLSFGHVLNRMFRFENIDGLKKNDSESLSILGSRFVWNLETFGVREITQLVAKNLIDNLHIKHVFITDYSFEIISSEQEIISPNNPMYEELATEISKVTFRNCYDSNENVDFFETPAIVTSLKIITCDTIDEIQELSIKYHLKKVTDNFYINESNAFNFIKTPWNKIRMPELIVTLNPDTIAENMGDFHLTADEFGFCVTLIHAIGKIYAIYESIHSASANLIMTSWNLDEIYKNLELTFNYWKRNFSNNEWIFYNLFREFKDLTLPLTLFVNNQTYQVFVEEYGSIIGFQIEYSFNTLRDSKVNKFIDPDLITKATEAFMDDLKMFSETLIEFIDKFQDTTNNWREIYRSKVNHYQMLGTMIALLYIAS